MSVGRSLKISQWSSICFV